MPRRNNHTPINSDDDKLNCVLLAHGAVCKNNVINEYPQISPTVNLNISDWVYVYDLYLYPSYISVTAR